MRRLVENLFNHYAKGPQNGPKYIDKVKLKLMLVNNSYIEKLELQK